jgi:SAM-dependent methyltransferase
MKNWASHWLRARARQLASKRRPLRFLARVARRLLAAGPRTEAADRDRVSVFWEEQFERMSADDSYWCNNNLIADQVQRLISRGSTKHWLSWLLQDYFRDHQPFARSLSLCCGDGAHELTLYQSGKVRFVQGFDISAGAVRQANAKFLQAGAPRDAFLFEARDANNLDLRGRFDLILSTGALHHVTALEDLAEKVHALLDVDGYFVVLEFVGPNRFQWTARQCGLINGLLAQLDPYYLKDRTRTTMAPLTVEEMLRIDPSEAVRSEDVLPVVRARFKVEYKSAYNGTLIHQLYPLLNVALGNRARPDFDSVVRLLLYFEDVLIREGLLPSDFVFLICRRQDHPGGSRPHAA